MLIFEPMKVTGFTFIRNAVRFDYPIVEAVRSILPLCDSVIVALGASDDGTEELVQSIDPAKVKIVPTVWDDTIREGGRVLAEETNKALAAVPTDSDWALYIQGDEVLHEHSYEPLTTAMQRLLFARNVDGLLFNYLHFYGSYDYVGTSPNWYRNEIRLFKPNRGVTSYRDAQGFRKGAEEKLSVVPVDAWIYHYGWVKPPAAMQRKQETFNRLWHNDEWVRENIAAGDEFDYVAHVRELARFKGTHPGVMLDRIRDRNWDFPFDISMNRSSVRDKVKDFLRTRCGIDLSYRNYSIVKPTW
jgi:glycosyltransferase involved in cell wall biosynthesis